MRCFACLTMLLLPVALLGPADRQSRMSNYPQLISTRYAIGAQLPEGVKPPTPAFDFIDKAKSPAGVNILSAAKSVTGKIWVVTDKGAYRSAGAGAGFEPLAKAVEATRTQRTCHSC